MFKDYGDQKLMKVETLVIMLNQLLLDLSTGSNRHPSKIQLSDLLQWDLFDSDGVVALDPLLTKVAFLKSINDECYLRDIVFSVIAMNRACQSDPKIINLSKAESSTTRISMS